jgi:hypothetical protein
VRFLQGYEDLIYLSLITSPRLDLGFLVRIRRKILIYYAAKPFHGLEFRIPVKPILLPHLGLTKNESQWFSGYPVRPPRFSLRRRHGYIPAERIHMRIPGDTGRILGSYLRDKSRHSSFVAITQLENLMS